MAKKLETSRSKCKGERELMAGVYHNGDWVEISGSTIINTQKIEEKLAEDNDFEFQRALEWILNNGVNHE